LQSHNKQTVEMKFATTGAHAWNFYAKTSLAMRPGLVEKAI
jgi:hypothetical protein